jgi:heme exporter protein B
VRPGLLRQTAGVLAKDLRIEFRQPARISGIFFFALALVLMVGFASPSEGGLRDSAAGTLWIGLLLASTRSLDQSYVVETETGALEGLALWPVEPLALFYGKALANTLILFAVAVGLLPFVVAIYHAPIAGMTFAELLSFPPGGPHARHLGLVVSFLILGSAALAVAGTLYGLISAEARGSSVLLPLLMFPLLVPVLVAAASGTTVLFEGDPMNQATSWLEALAIWIVVFWPLMGLFYGMLVENND